MQPRLRVVPLRLRQANRLVELWHRHHKATRGCRFCIGVVDEQGLVHGALVAGRPVGRLAGDPDKVLEVTRLATDGTPNACSALYAAAARAGKELGFVRIQTYILDTEPGTSLKAAGWVDEGLGVGGKWHHSDSDSPRRQDQPTCPKRRWSKALNPDYDKP